MHYDFSTKALTISEVSLGRLLNQLVVGLNPPLIEDHQIEDLVGVLNPLIHLDATRMHRIHAEFWLLTPEFC